MDKEKELRISEERERMQSMMETRLVISAQN
jgi:hypothetical protein